MTNSNILSKRVLFIAFLSIMFYATTGLAETSPEHVNSFPRALESYDDQGSVWTVLKSRALEEPFNLVATCIFLLAIIHTFLTSKFLEISSRWADLHKERIKRGEVSRDSIHHGARLMHFFGEVEVVFGLWAVPLIIAIIAFYDWNTVVHYFGGTINFTESAFVVVIMTLAATRPILKISENIIQSVAAMFGGSLSARWFTTLTVGPLLGSFITEPAAITISAMILARTFYSLEPSTKFRYATLGLLLVNISVGGTLTHFAAPPVLMVAAPWGWGLSHMLLHFGWKAAAGIVLCNGLYFILFRRELVKLESKFALVNLKEEIQKRYLKREEVDAHFESLERNLRKEVGTRTAIETQIQDTSNRIRNEMEEQFFPELREKGIDEGTIREAFSLRFQEIQMREIRRLVPCLLPANQRGLLVDPDWDKRDDPVPAWVTLVHVLFMGWTIVTAHHAPLFILGMLFFLGFAKVSEDYQNRISLVPAMLVGFFLAGLVIHGGVQGWWIEPILGSLGEVPLMATATALTAFNDNAAITYLATLVPDFSDAMKYAVVAGAVTGGGLTIIANAPNPAGISLLKKYFDHGVSPAGLLGASIVPTLIFFMIFLVTR
jgi:Putative Na+/H+ antiporter